jgi:predicted transposase YbfD/YdcC
VLSNRSSFVLHFSRLEDPRIDRSKLHPLPSIVAIAVMAALCGIDSFKGMATFASYKLSWLKTFLSLPNGAPSHDTFNRVFARIKPDKFQECFVDWMKDVAELTAGEVVAIDGKTVRHSFDRASSKAPIQMVSAWATSNGLSLGQVKVDAESNEITAIPKLLETLCLKGCIVTIDAAGCQREIAEKIRAQGADYTLALKGNQEHLHADVVEFFDQPPVDATFTAKKTTDSKHGRGEFREYAVTDDVGWLKETHAWPGLQSIGRVVAHRLVDGEWTKATRYFVNSYGANVDKFAGAVRDHWRVETSLHWVLDVIYDDDGSRVRKDHGAENLSTLRRIAINMLRRNTWKETLPQKQIRAAHDLDYMLKLLTT